jgi:uncharacterized protein DUF4400
MIRIVWIAAMCCVLCLVLYVPSAVSPDQLMLTVRAEHQINSRLWGDSAADRILERMLDFQVGSVAVSTPPPATVQLGGPGINAAMAAEFGQMSTRLFSSPYFKSVDAMFSLAALRAATLLHVLPLLLVFMAICAVDGFAVRSVRAREFAAHSAEVFTASATLGIALLALVLVGVFLPFTLGPLYMIGALLLMLFVLSRAIANYHSIR